MKRLSKHTTRILSLLLAMIMLAVMLPLAVILPASQPVYAANNGAFINGSLIFNASGNFLVPANVSSIDLLVVGGGGGGAGDGAYTYACGGGGGAGGLIYKYNYTVTPGTNFSIIVGAGGAGGATGSNYGVNGSATSFRNTTYGYNVTAMGGGGGGYGAVNGRDGGSGGGSGVRTSNNATDFGDGIVGQGNNGAFGYQDGSASNNAAGGGGGNGSPGVRGTSQDGGDGGSGSDYSAIFGTGFNTSGVFAGGGGGGCYYASTGGATTGGGGVGAGANHGSSGVAGGAAKNNSGGGGGGGAAGSSSSSGGAGGKGGYGIVIIRYNYFLNISAGSGGTVTNPGTGIFKFTNGTNVSLVATPNPCYTFVNWSGPNASSVYNISAAFTNITIRGNYSITANFIYNCYNLTTSVVGNGTVTPNTSNPHVNGSIVQLTAVPNSSCWTFSGWSGDLSGATNPANITMNSNKSVTATFTINGSYNVTYSAGPGGTITGVNSTRYTTDIYTSASDGFLTNTSYSTYNAAWSAANGTLDNASSYFHIGQAYNVAYQAFRAFVYFNTATIPSGASISSANVSLRGGNDQSGTDFDITIQNGMPTYPHDPFIAGDYANSDYSGNGGSFNTAAFVYNYMNISLNPTGISWINTAGWTKLCLRSSREIAGTTPAGLEYIEVVANELGSLRPYLEVVYNLTTPQTVTCGASGPTVTAVPNACYHFVNWSDGSTQNPRTDLNVIANITVTANFAINTSTLTYNAGAHGTINGTTPQIVNCGASGTAVTAVPDAYYTFVIWSDGVTTASRTDTNVTADKTVTATFAIYSYMLSISTDGAGTTTPGAGTHGPYTNGTVVSIAATPNSCYAFDNWSGNTGTIQNVISNSTTIIMNGDYSINANFALYSYILQVSANNSYNTPYFSGLNPFVCNASVSIYANTSSGYVFAGWTPTDGITNASAANTSVLMTQHRNLIASYTANASTPTPTPTPTPTGNITNTTYLSWHIAPGNFSLTRSAKYIIANISAGINGNRGKYIVKQLTVYIKQRPVLSGLGRGGIWGDNAIVCLGSLTISGPADGHGAFDLFNGNIYVNGSVTVNALGDGSMVSGTLYCNTYSFTGSDFTYGAVATLCPVQTLPSRGVPQDFFQTNLSTGTQNWSQADQYHEYAWNSSIWLTNVNEVFLNNDPSTLQFKPGYYYCNGTMVLYGHMLRGAVTLIAKQILIFNDDTTSNGSAYIGLGPYDADNMLLWATGNSGNDIWINQIGEARSHPCVELEGVLYAPNGEVQLIGSGSNPVAWGWLTIPSVKAMIYNGGIRAQNLTITGHDWWFYRW